MKVDCVVPCFCRKSIDNRENYVPVSLSNRQKQFNEKYWGERTITAKERLNSNKIRIQNRFYQSRLDPQILIWIRESRIFGISVAAL